MSKRNTKQLAPQDKNFDQLASKFAKNIYGTPKGQIRAAILWRDLAAVLAQYPDQKLRILDAGGGFGYMSQRLAQLGHQVVLCDISAQMLTLAQEQITAQEAKLDIELVHAPIQELSQQQFGQFDLILCHAVTEWLVDAEATLAHLTTLLKRNGHFSLMFYNKEAMRFHNLVSGNFDYVAAGLTVKKKIGLTPTHPVYIEQVRGWVKNWQMHTMTESGVRVINDYLKDQQPSNFEFDKLLQMELEYSRVEPYRSLGRYVHFICCFNQETIP